MVLSNQSKQKLFDPLRRTWLDRKQEEAVRQAFLNHMIQNLSYPKERLLVEKTLARLPNLESKAGLPNRRIDIICYEKEEKAFTPLLVIECKYKMIDVAAFHQLFGYNHYLGAPFLAVVSTNSVLFRYFHKSASEHRFLNFLPSYLELIHAKDCKNDPFRV